MLNKNMRYIGNVYLSYAIFNAYLGGVYGGDQADI